MSKPGKSLRTLCKKLGVRLTVKRGKKRVYKNVKVLKRQCKRKVKKKKKKKVKRKFGKNTTFKTLKKYAIPASIGAGLGVAGTALGMKVYLNNLYFKILNNEIQPENVPSLILKILDKRFKYQNYIKDVANQIGRDYERLGINSRPDVNKTIFSIDFNKHIRRYTKALKNLKNRDSMSVYYEDALMLPHKIQFVTQMKKYRTILFNKNIYISIKKAKELYPENFLSKNKTWNEERIQDENEKLKESIAHKQLKDSIELYNMMRMEDEAVYNVLNEENIDLEHEVMLFGKKKRRKRKKKK